MNNHKRINKFQKNLNYILHNKIKVTYNLLNQAEVTFKTLIINTKTKIIKNYIKNTKRINNILMISLRMKTNELNFLKNR